MKRDIIYWQYAGFAFTAIMGTLLHFLYEWSGKSAVAALISGVNESTWEHMKLLFFPMLGFALIQSRYFKDTESFWSIKLKGSLIGLLLIPVIFYTYNGAIGKSPDWFNIIIFFVSAATVYIYETLLFKKESKRYPCNRISFILLLVMAALFIVFTFCTPRLPIFMDPLTGTYGI